MNEPCCICGRNADHMHHIIYRSQWKEGIDVAANMCPVCADCHRQLHNHQVLVPKSRWLKAAGAWNVWKSQNLPKRSDNPISSRRYLQQDVSHQNVDFEEALRDYRKERYRKLKEMRNKK